MRRINSRTISFFAIFLSVATAQAQDAPGKKNLLFFAAASTTDAVEEICVAYSKQHPDVSVKTSFAASSVLAKQIAAGADAQLFLSANQEWADFLTKQGLVARERALLGNQLAIIVGVDFGAPIAGPRDLLDARVRQLALGDPNSVPAGKYARQALTKLDLWNSLKEKVVGAADVRQALQYVDSGAAEAGIVYATDAKAGKHVRVAATLDPALCDPVEYPLVLLKPAAADPAAGSLFEFLSSDDAAQIFQRHGFLTLSGPKGVGPNP
jgi:molybdate transport system substrate-binding protein